MIVTQQKDFEVIVHMLEGKKRVFLVGCGECATTCKTGGEEDIKKLKPKLEQAGKVVTGMVVPEATCIASHVKKAMAKHRAEMIAADAVLVFSCGSGTQAMQENDRLNKPMYSGNDTLFAASVDSKGNFQEVCSACGDCMLDVAGGLCPITRCPKGIVNGPCGGQKQGMCEVDQNKDCVWVMIYKAKQKNNTVSDLHAIRKPRNYKKSLRPRMIERPS